MVKDCPNVKIQAKVKSQAQSSSPSSESPKRNRFYALKVRGKQENSYYIMTGMLQVFSVNVYVLLDPGSTFILLHPW